MRGWIPGALCLLCLVPARGLGQEMWAGHQVVKGARSVPILGTLETRTDSFYLATVERKEGEIHLSQKTCRMDIARFAGVKVSFLEEGVPKMPPSRIVYRSRGEQWEAGPWITEWQEQDVDQDGKPGATISVEAPICGGTIFVSGFSKAIARGAEGKQGLEGEIRAQVGHRILGTSGGCIKLVAKDSEETVAGTFAYTPVPADATCESLQGGGWPAKAAEPEKPGKEAAPRKDRKRIR